MSLTDPAIARRAKADRAPARRHVLTFGVALPLMVLADVAVVAVVFGPLLGGARYAAVNELAQTDLPGEVWQVFAAAVGIPASIILGLLVIAGSRARLGLIPAALARVAMWFAIAAALVAPLSTLWLPLGSPAQGPWVTLASWLPLVLGALAAAIALAAVIIAVPRRDHLGVIVDGTVTAVEQLGQRRDDSNLVVREVMLRVTASFRDAQGSTRWAEQSGFAAPNSVPAVGDRVRVSYEQNRPKRALLDIAWARPSRQFPA